jgi:uncharacterized membrane protein
MNRAEEEPRNLKRRRALHRFFEVGVVAKGIDGALELIGGLLLLFLSPAAIRGIIRFLVQGELKEDPTDLVANLLLNNTRNIVESRVRASVFLILHGAVKLALVVGLATNRRWSYPVAIAVFAGFTAYQLYQLTRQASLFMGVVTVVDVIVIALIAAEYRHLTSSRKEAESAAS